MIYRFDPVWFQGLLFQFEDSSMKQGWMTYQFNRQPVPASYFPPTLVIKRAKAPMPDLFHTSRGIFVVSARARAVFEKEAPGQVEFLPVEITTTPMDWRNPFVSTWYSMQDLGRSVLAPFMSGMVDFIPVCDEPRPRITPRLNLASAYYFINILGHAQRLLWLQSPTRDYNLPEADGTIIAGLHHEYDKWRFSTRSPGDPLIWREDWWRHGNRVYRCQHEAFLEESLWRALEAKFPGQLDARPVGQG